MILLEKDFCDLFSVFSITFKFRLRRLYQTFKTLFDHTSKHLKARQNTPLCVEFSTLFSVFKCVQMRSFFVWYITYKMCKGTNDQDDSLFNVWLILSSSGLMETLCPNVRWSVKNDFCSFKNYSFTDYLRWTRIQTISDSLLPK